MAAKKITVLGFADDDSLTSDEAYKIEVRVDRMLSVETPDNEPVDADLPAEAVEQNEITPAPIVEIAEPVGAPPLDKKLAKKIMISEPEAEPEKKYRPPDGPMPFKRAEPATETSPAETRDNFEPPLKAASSQSPRLGDNQAHKRPVAVPKPNHKKLVGLLFALGIIGGVAAAVILIPSVRQRFDSLIDRLPGQTSKTTQQAVVQTPTNPTTTTTATTPLPDIFLAKQGGVYNLYKIDQSGQNQQQLLAGSGNETSPTTQLVASPDAKQAALVSTRDKTKDAAGYTLQSLQIIDTTSAAATTVTQAQRVQLLGWYGTRLLYQTSKTGPAAASDNNSDQLLAYNTATKQTQVLDHAVHFSAVRAVPNGIFYATDGATAALYRLNPDGTSKRKLLSAPVMAIYRDTYSTLTFAAGTSWYNLDISSTNALPRGTVTAYAGTNRLYIDAPDHHHSLYIAPKNGVPTLLVYDVATKKEVVLSQKAGLGYPAHWLTNSVVVFRVDTAAETADYKVDLIIKTISKLIDTSGFHGLEP